MARFKKSEWQYGLTKSLLTDLIKNHYNSKFDLQQNGWTEKDIWHFLQLHHWIYPQPQAQHHHYRTCESIIIKELST